MAEANDGNWKIQLNLKHGFNSLDLLNVRVETIPELLEILDAISQNATVIAGATADFKAAHAVGSTFPGAETVPFDGAKAVQVTPPAPAASGGKVCAHGVPYKFNSGEKNGKKWSGWFCQVENDPAQPKCKAIWAN